MSHSHAAITEDLALNSAVEVLSVDTAHIELCDRRTGLHLSVEGWRDDNGGLASDLQQMLDQLGLRQSLPIPELRTRQRPFRVQMQRELRNEALREFLDFASAQVPFYREDHKYGLAGIGDIDELATLPILNKADLRQNFDNLLARSADIATGLSSGSLRIARTSGTTDERIQVFSDMRMDQVPPDYEDVWGVTFRGRTPRTAILTTPLCSATECHLGRLPMEKRIHSEIVLYLNSTEDLFSAPENLIRNIAEELLVFRPEILLVNPYYLMWFGREAQRLKLDLPQVELILTSYQYTSKIHKRALAQMFGAPVYNTYSATELAGCRLGLECKNGHWHVYENHSIIEIVDEDGHRVDDRIGSVVATAVAGRLMPLVRYDVGDLARADDTDCDCPLSDWQCFEFHGRKKDVLKLNGRAFTTKQVDDIFSEIAGIDFYRCIQNGESSLAIDIIAAPGARVNEQDIEKHIRERLPADRVAIRRVSRLDPEPSMKFCLTARDMSVKAGS